MANVLAISGKKRSGKDWTAAAIKSELEQLGYSVDIIAFADPMKDILATTFGISLEQLDHYKNQNDRFKLNFVDYLSGEHLESGDARVFLQRFGNEAMKSYFGPHVWRDLAIKRIAESDADYVIISDFRMPEEVIPGMVSIRINSDSVDVTDTHRSENGLEDYLFDFELDNSNKALTQPLIEGFVRNTILFKENDVN